MFDVVRTSGTAADVTNVEWVILDTSVVRGIIESETDALDPDELAAIKGSRRISIADGAVAELWHWLLRAPVEVLRKVRPGLLRLERCLDQEFPFAPSARGGASFAGIVPWKEGDSQAEQASHSRACWQHLTRVRSPGDLTRKMKYRDSSGRLALLVPRPPAATSLLRDMQDKWLPPIVAQSLREQGIERMTDQDEQQFIARWREKLLSALGIAVSDPRSGRLDLYLQSLARRVRIHRPARYPTSNAAMDNALLLYLLLPALICTADSKLVNFVRALPSPDRLLVMRPDELILRLRAASGE
jgi:hypothetical protein